MKKRKLDLAGHLQKTKQRKILTWILIPIIGVLILFAFNCFLKNIPWHWQLFLRWVFRGGDVTHIPKKFYKELNELCLIASPSGRISAHQSENLELAYALGTFECQLANDREHWIIRDIKFFTHPKEASSGSLLAVLLVSMEGTDYSYKIEAIIPVIKNNNL